MRKETLLRLLLLGDGLETAEDWAVAVGEADEGEGDGDALDRGGEAEEEAHAPLVAAIDEVVPHLPDYSAVSSKLKGLLGYAEKVYPGQVNRLLQGWLKRTPVYDVPFRRWVLLDWLKCSHLTSADAEALLQWRHALFVAATSETVATLKRTQLGYIDAVDGALADRFDGEIVDTSLSSAPPTAASQSIETVEELLDFCWVHAEQLVSCSLMCAAKLHALAVRTQRGASKLAEDEEVLVRLRWSLMLKPLLFKPLLQHAIALKVLPAKMVASQVWMSDELSVLVGLVDLASREKILMEMEASRDDLESAFSSAAAHVHVTKPDTKEASLVGGPIGKYMESLPVDKKKLLLAELERDVDDAPPHLFPHVFMVFSLVVGGLLSSAHGSKLLVNAVEVLFSVFHRRIHDPSSCLDALGLLLRLSLATHPLWQDDAPFYLDTVDSLSETATIQVDPKVKWIAQMALQQLLFECDAQLLHQNQMDLRNLLPPSAMRLVSIRLGA